jgi:hypothetical protein
MHRLGEGVGVDVVLNQQDLQGWELGAGMSVDGWAGQACVPAGLSTQLAFF